MKLPICESANMRAGMSSWWIGSRVDSYFWNKIHPSSVDSVVLDFWKQEWRNQGFAQSHFCVVMFCRFLFFKTSLHNILSITLISKQLVVWLTALSLDAFDCRMKEFMEGFSVISMKLKEPCDERMVFMMMLRDMCLKDCQMHNGDTDAECVHWQLLYTLFFEKVPWKPSNHACVSMEHVFLFMLV